MRQLQRRVKTLGKSRSLGISHIEHTVPLNNWLSITLANPFSNRSSSIHQTCVLLFPIMKNSRDCSFGYLLLPVVLGQDDHAVCADQLARGGLVGSSQVEEVVGWAARLAFTHEVVILCSSDNLAAMGDGLDIVLILMARLIQCVLVERRQR